MLYKQKLEKYNNIDTCFGYKDPRLSIMLDIVCKKLKQDGYIPVVFLCWRNCHDIAQSLIKRDHFTIEKAMNVATSYQFILGSTMVPFLEHHNIEYLNITFERLVTRPAHIVKEIASFVQSVIGLHIRPISIQKAIEVVRVRPAI
ncbi:MAG: hypothetical protein GXO10_06610 [Crenarchaeota archaeon]|nr:hypothetical protein [Thermoproteota archaeon]